MGPTKISYFHIRVPTWIFHVFRTKWFHSKTCKTSLIHLKAVFSQFFEYFSKNIFCLRLRKGTCGVTNALIAVKNTCKNENFEELNTCSCLSCSKMGQIYSFSCQKFDFLKYQRFKTGNGTFHFLTHVQNLYVKLNLDEHSSPNIRKIWQKHD